MMIRRVRSLYCGKLRLACERRYYTLRIPKSIALRMYERLREFQDNRVRKPELLDARGNLANLTPRVSPGIVRIGSQDPCSLIAN